VVSDRRRLLHALLRQDLPSFIAKCLATLEPGTRYRENWHVRHIAFHLDRVARGQCRRLILNIPPRHLKSICVTVAFTAWRLGHDPGLKVMAVSYAHDLTRKHALDFRTVVESEWYRQVFPQLRIEPRRNRDIELVTTAQGSRFATSVGGSVLGRGADLIVIDDPIKALDALSEAERRRVREFYDNTLYTRLNDKTTGAIVIVMQRLHADDLVGHVLAKEDWEVVTISAIETEDRAYRLGPEPGDVYRRRAGEVLHAEREPAAVLEQLRRTLGSLNFSAQYQQNPLPQEGNLIRREWIRYYEAVPRPLDLTVVSWDTASTLAETSDWSVGTVWGLRGSDIYLLDVVRGRFEVPELRRRIEAVHREHGADATLIEDTDIGRAIGQELRRAGPLRPLLPRPRFDKTARLLAQSPKFEAGQVLLPREAPWLAEYLEELLGFPNARHDDQVDSTSQALRWLSDKIARGTPPVRPNPTRPPGARIVRSGTG
jgi:predicted phage terminase large subunit-like protein